MKSKLTKDDYIELHHRILEEVIRGEDGRAVFDFNYYRQICFLVFNRKGEPKRVVLNPEAYITEEEMQRRIKLSRTLSNARVEAAEEEIELYDAAYYGDGLAMATARMDDSDRYLNI